MASLLQAVIVTPVFFLLVPYTIGKIGAEGYGVFALTGVIASYQVFVEMGLTTTLIRFVAKARVDHQIEAITRYIGTTLIAFLAVSLAVFVIIWFLAGVIATHILRLSGDLPPLVFLIRIAAVTALINLLSGVFKSAIDGYQRMDVTNAILAGQVLLTAAGTVIALEAGYGIRGLLVNGMVVSLLSLAANFYFAGKIIQYRFRFVFDRQRFAEMFRYSVNLQLSGLLYFWIEPLNKILIANFFPVSFVGYYDIALKFNSRITTLVRSGLAPMFPAAAEKFQQSGTSGIERLRTNSLKYLFPLLTFLYIAGLLAAPGFIRLWLGEGYSYVRIAVMIFLAGSYFSLLSTPAYILLLGSGFSADTLRIQWQSMLVNVSVIIILAWLAGFAGFCAGYAFSMFYGFFATHRFYRRRFDLKTNALDAFLDRKVFFSSLLIAATGVAFILITGNDSWLKFSLMMIAMTLVALASLWRFRILNIRDIRVLTGIFNP